MVRAVLDVIDGKRAQQIGAARDHILDALCPGSVDDVKPRREVIAQEPVKPSWARHDLHIHEDADCCASALGTPHFDGVESGTNTRLQSAIGKGDGAHTRALPKSE